MAGSMGGSGIMAGRMGGMGFIMDWRMGATGVIMGFFTSWTGGVRFMILRMLGLRVLMTCPQMVAGKGTWNSNLSACDCDAPSPCSVLLECAACSS